MNARNTLHPDAMAAKYQVFKDWRNGPGRPRLESLGAWTTTRAEDGALTVSAEVRGPRPAEAVFEFTDWQTRYLTTLGQPGDRMPEMDVSEPYKTVVRWRQGGVWVELWYGPGSIRRPRRLSLIIRRRKEATTA